MNTFLSFLSTYLRMLKKLVIKICQLLALALFFLCYPFAVIYAWPRYFFKRLIDLPPKVLLSPIGGPVPYFNQLTLKKAGYQVDIFAFNWPKYFQSIKAGYILSDRPVMAKWAYLSNYVFFFLTALFKYDLFEMPFSGGLLMHSSLRKGELLLLKLAAKKILVAGYGSDCKILSQVKKGHKYNNAMDRSDAAEAFPESVVRANVLRAQKYADVLISGGDAIHLGRKAIILPLATDLKFWSFEKPPKGKKVVILHSTNHRSHKGTRFIIKAVEKLKDSLPIKLLLLEGKNFEECRKIYPQADIFITDVITGWHGFTAIEAMAIGRPVIAYLRPDIAQHHAYYAKGRIPIVSANPDTLARAITKLVKDRKWREELGQKGRQYALKFHSFEFVGALRRIIYEYIWTNQKINQKIFEREVKRRKLI